MRFETLIEAWNDFLFTPRSPLPISLFRILYGTMVAATLLLLHRDWLGWLGAHAWVSRATMSQIEPGPRLNLFSVIPQSDTAIELLFWVVLIAAIFLVLGFLTRFSTVLVFVCLTSIQQRNPFVIHSGDVFLRVAGFFLMFAPAGAAMSIDRVIRVRRGKEGADIPSRNLWAQRLIQFELSLMYVTSFWWKSQGESWVDGTALYYVLHLNEIRRFPLPQWMTQVVMVKLETWFALALELALGTLIWIKEFRYPMLAAGVAFHLFLEYSFNIPMFQWDVLSAYVLFLRPEDIARVQNRLLKFLSLAVK